MYLSPNTHKHQSSLANYCRTGNYSPIPGVKEKNVARYRELVYNAVNDSLQAAYPLTYYLLAPEEWDTLVSEFFGSHRCQSPQVWQMPRELYEYAVETNHPLSSRYPFLFDLLLFEWKEVEVYMMEDEQTHSFSENFQGDCRIVLNPEIRVLLLEYPVHLNNAFEIAPEDKGTYFVCLHRHPATGRVLFTDIHYPHVQVIELLADHPAPEKELLSVFLNYAREPEAQQALDDFIFASLSSKLILGFLNN